MGNLHNPFGSTDAAHIRLAPGGEYQVDHVVRGDTNSDVLEMMEHDPNLLLERFRVASEKAISSGKLRINESRRLMDHLESSLNQSTYLQN
jgi:arginine decarboxylase